LASGDYSTVPGGQSNTASGLRSFAAGATAVASHSDSAAFGFSNAACASVGAGSINFCVSDSVYINGSPIVLGRRQLEEQSAVVDEHTFQIAQLTALVEQQQQQIAELLRAVVDRQ